MRYAWMTLMLMFLTTTLLACQPAESFVSTDIAETNSSTQNNATATSAPTLSAEDTTMTPVTPPDEATAKMVALVTQHLAQRLSVAVDQIVLSDVKPVVWRDAGLGCPKPGVDYIQMGTPGYTIFLEAGGKTYNYHTDETKRFVLCSK